MEASLTKGSKKEPRIEFGYNRLSMECAFLKLVVEGYWVGHLVWQGCNARTTGYDMLPTLYAHGQEGSGDAWDVYVDEKVNTYKISPPWKVRFNQAVTANC